MIKQIKQKNQKIYEIYEIQTQLRQLTKSELEKICFRMNCPKGTKNEMITSLLKPLQSKTIYHASRHRSGGYGSEYIYPKTGKISITNHGMGSGIYGLSKQKMFSEDSKIPIENSKIYMYTVNNPIILDSETCTIYQEASKGLNDELEKVVIPVAEYKNWHDNYTLSWLTGITACSLSENKKEDRKGQCSTISHDFYSQLNS